MTPGSLVVAQPAQQMCLITSKFFKICCNTNQQHRFNHPGGLQLLSDFHFPLLVVEQLLRAAPSIPSCLQISDASHYTSKRLPHSFSPNLQQYKAAVNSLLNDNRKLAESTISPFKRYLYMAQFYIKRKTNVLPVMTLISGYWLSQRVTALLSLSNASRSSFLTAAEPHNRYRPTT